MFEAVAVLLTPVSSFICCFTRHGLSGIPDVLTGVIEVQDLGGPALGKHSRNTVPDPTGAIPQDDDLVC